MPYTLEPISEADKQRVFDEADFHKQAWLRVRSFFLLADGNWAIDRASGSYLTWVPTRLARGRDKNFFFRFEGKTYALRVRNGFGPQVAIDDPIDESERDRIQEEIALAFSVHQLFGRKFTPRFGETWPADSVY